jgi:hypothetical protein
MVQRLAARVSVILTRITAASSPGLAQAQQAANPGVSSAVAALAGGLVARGECTEIAVGTNDHGIGISSIRRTRGGCNEARVFEECRRIQEGDLRYQSRPRARLVRAGLEEGAGLQVDSSLEVAEFFGLCVRSTPASSLYRHLRDGVSQRPAGVHRPGRIPCEPSTS